MSINLKQTQFRATSQARETFSKYAPLRNVSPGLLGDGEGTVDVEDREGWVYVRVDNSLVQAFNNRVASVENTPVFIGYDQLNPTVLQVLSVDIGSIALGVEGEIVYAPLANHSESHEYLNPLGGYDVVFTELRQYQPFRPYISDDFEITISRGNIVANGVVVNLNVNTAYDLTSRVPASGATFILLYLDGQGTVQIMDGVNDPASIYLLMSAIPMPPPDSYPLAAVRLYQGQTEIQEDNDITDLVDLRFSMMRALWTGTTSQRTALTLTAVNTGQQYYDLDGDKLYVWITDDWEQVVLAKDLFPLIGALTGEPTGFPNRTDSELSVNDSTGAITIEPASDSFDVYWQGEKATFTDPVTTGSASSGMNYLYWDGSDLIFGTSVWDILLHVPATYIYFNASNPGTYHAILFEERHGLQMDAATHRRLHFSIGNTIESGLAIGSYTPSTDTDASKKFTISNGTQADEDIFFSNPGISAGGPYRVFYRYGTTEWRWRDANYNANDDNTLPLIRKTSGSYLVYNQVSGGSWSLTDAINNRYINYFVAAVPVLSPAGFEIILIMGQTEHTSLSSAQSEGWQSLLFGTIPFAEISPIARITYATNASYTSTGKCVIAAVQDLRRVSTPGTPAVPVDHASLSGRDLAGQHPATAITTDTTNFNALESTDDTAQKAFEKLDTLLSTTSMSLYQLLPQLRGLWTMNSVDYNGDIYDMSEQGQKMTNVNAPTFGISGLLPYTTMNGTSQYFYLADSSNLDITGALTLGAWIYRDSTSATVKNIIGKRSSGDGDLAYALRAISNHQLSMFVTSTGSGGSEVYSTNNTKYNDWSFCVGRYIPSTELAVFLDGTFDKITSSIPASIYNSPEELKIGASGGPSEYFYGRIGMCFLCATALSDDHIDFLHRVTKSLFLLP